MSASTLLAAGLLAVVAGLAYAAVGRSLGRRTAEAEGPAKLALQGFALWWLALSGATLVGATQTLLAGAGALTLEVAVTGAHLGLLLASVALAGLLYYMVYLFTGRQGVLVPIAALYAGVYVLMLFFTVASQPSGIALDAWAVRLTYARPPGGPLLLGLVVLLLLPQMVAAAAYLTLLRRVRDPTSRWRIVLVSASILVWFGTAFLAGTQGLAGGDAWQLGSRFIGLGAAYAAYAAYHPPQWARERFGVRPVGPERESPRVA